MQETERLDQTFTADPPREDLRTIPHVTIDGESAKDFDDAVCVIKSRRGFRLYVSIADFVLAAMQITQVFAVRLAILTLATPVFGLFALVALVDGLVRRDLRRWGGGRESSFVYHYAKKASIPLIIIAWVLYLSLPFSVHPSWVILPFAIGFGLAVTVTASTFKKYL